MPGWWEPLRSPVVTMVLILLLPAAVAALLGLAIFRRRVKGAYFAILSQALAAAFAIFLIGQQTTTGGTNGLNGFRGFFGYNLYDPLNKRLLFFIAATALLVMVVVVWHLYRSRFGELLVAVRDQEERVRFLGYNPANIKLVAYVVAAAMAGDRRRAVRADRRHHLPRRRRRRARRSPSSSASPSAAGTPCSARCSARSSSRTRRPRCRSSSPAFWTYFQGAMFMLVVAFLPGGIASLTGAVRATRSGRRRAPAAAEPSDQPDRPTVDRDRRRPSRR